MEFGTGTIGVTLLMFLLLALPMVLMVVVGIVVYKDAKAHDLNPWLWTAIAVITPNLIGVIIYLVVRSNQEKKYNCSNCNAEVKVDYNICPSCQAVFENTCEVCKHAVGSQMTYCPYCGSKVEEHTVHQTATKVTKKTSLVKPLSIIGGICIALFIALFGMVFVMGIASGTFDTNVSVGAIETSMGDHLKASFYYRIGNDHVKVRKQAGEELHLEGFINVEKGKITLTIEDPQEKVVYIQTYTENQELNHVMPITSDGKYKVMLKIEEAKGSYDLRVN